MEETLAIISVSHYRRAVVLIKRVTVKRSHNPHACAICGKEVASAHTVYVIVNQGESTPIDSFRGCPEHEKILSTRFTKIIEQIPRKIATEEDVKAYEAAFESEGLFVHGI